MTIASPSSVLQRPPTGEPLMDREPARAQDLSGATPFDALLAQRTRVMPSGVMAQSMATRDGPERVTTPEERARRERRDAGRETGEPSLAGLASVEMRTAGGPGAVMESVQAEKTSAGTAKTAGSEPEQAAPTSGRAAATEPKTSSTSTSAPATSAPRDDASHGSMQSPRKGSDLPAQAALSSATKIGAAPAASAATSTRAVAGISATSASPNASRGGPVARDSSALLARLKDGARPARQHVLSAKPDETFAAQLQRGLAAALKDGGTVTMRLNPEKLGAVQVRLDVQDGQVAAAFRVESPEARRLLDQELPALRSALEARGLDVDRIHIDAPAARHETDGHDQQAADRSAAHEQHTRDAWNQQRQEAATSGEHRDGAMPRERRMSTHERAQEQPGGDWAGPGIGLTTIGGAMTVRLDAIA